MKIKGKSLKKKDAFCYRRGWVNSTKWAAGKFSETEELDSQSINLDP